ncbi:glycosyltransferase family 4 protein [Aquipseudomonas ullengensis]|uniref:Glycosyltransferase family 4 protein n=1 Tax=Aquipseudomonas ullengensis TaxID=2759166 RepID=A0A7W4QBE5_9GAMM|nr:glycosyltransferase family 4 protein [Pseudomonas ullengensis]MBB2496847.1 glycosyltransferase family 4 protein [Pseudomonas ullengensis]
MKVLHFYKTYYPDSVGGVEQVIFQIANGVADLGVSTDVLSLSSDATQQPVNLGSHTAYKAKLDLQVASTGFSLSVFRKFSALAKQADIIHYHFPWPFMDMVHLASRLNKPSLVTYHSDIVRQAFLLQLYRPLMNSFLKSVDSIVATSPNYLHSSPVLQQFRDKTQVIPIGLDKPAYPKPSQNTHDHWQQRFGERFFLFVGVLRYYKGLHILLEAMKGAPYKLVVIGAGPVEHELKAQATRDGLENVFFVGAVSDEDKVALLNLCYAVTFPSNLRSEAFGISLLEGAMYGKPMISSEIGTGTSYININNQTGLVVPPSDPLAFRQAMDHLWAHPELAQQMGREAENRYWEHFTAKRMAENYNDLYRQLLEQRNQNSSRDPALMS